MSRCTSKNQDSTKGERFAFFRSYYRALAEYPTECQEFLWSAIVRYVYAGESPQFDRFEDKMTNLAMRSIWEAILPNIEKSISQMGNDNALSKSETNVKPISNKSETNVKPISNPIEEDIEIDKDIEESKEKKRTSFVPPTLAEASDYIREKGYAISAEKFIAYYESVGWMRGKTKIKDWRAAVRTWHTQDNTAQTRLHIPEVQPRKFMTADELGI